MLNFGQRESQLEIATEFRGDVALDNGHALQLLQSSLSEFFLIVTSEMLNILRVRQLFLGSLIAMEFLEMVDLVFILHVPMMSRSEAEVR